MMQEVSGDRLLVAYSNNKFHLHNTSTNQLVKEVANIRWPQNYLNRYNRIYGVVQLTDSQFILYTHFTIIRIDLEQEVPESSLILDDHPHEVGDSWGERIKELQSGYLAKALGNQVTDQTQQKPKFEGNFTISNRFKGILAMKKVGEELVVVENVWKHLIKRMEDPLKIKKFGN